MLSHANSIAFAVCLAAFLGFWTAALSGSLPAPNAIAQPCAAQDQSGRCHSDGHNKSDDRSLIGWISIYHDAIEATAAVLAVGAAVWLAIVTGFLWSATKGLAESTDELARAGHEQSAEMLKSRKLAEEQHTLAHRQFFLTGRQTDLAEKQFGFQREQYLADHRPRLEVRNIGLDSSGKGGALFLPGFAPKGTMVIVNNGAANAIIRKSEYRFYWSRGGLPMVPPLIPDKVKPIFTEHPFTLEGHGSHTAIIESADVLGGWAHEIHQGTMDLYVIGAILLSDGGIDANFNARERWMGFCRVYSNIIEGSAEGRFIPVDNPDYEYQD